MTSINAWSTIRACSRRSETHRIPWQDFKETSRTLRTEIVEVSDGIETSLIRFRRPWTNCGKAWPISATPFRRTAPSRRTCLWPLTISPRPHSRRRTGQFPSPPPQCPDLGTRIDQGMNMKTRIILPALCLPWPADCPGASTPNRSSISRDTTCSTPDTGRRWRSTRKPQIHRVGLKPIILPGYLHDNRLTVRKSQNELIYLEQDRWAGRPAKVLADFLSPPTGKGTRNHGRPTGALEPGNRRLRTRHQVHPL